ncbi:hypothetical protein GCM10023160_02420 [Brachybacterium paraconglomeratum]
MERTTAVSRRPHMTQPPQPPQSPPGPHGQQPDGAPGGGPVIPQQGEPGGKSGRSKGPVLAAVGCGLLLLVLLLSLVGFFGVRALMGDGDEQSASSQEESPTEVDSSEPEEATEPEETTAQAEEDTAPEQSPEATEEAAPAGEANAHSPRT